ncbi:murein transglycosylase A [Entomobacter blattae]|uniref:peptidoglycan lytic exotransglycosylase n=1 Tax=Entomobacter blattae TaxID=2762277 RepID=A0A7H1NRV6_9PROT|nr:murein transglycosylase A [Entomobacter blattae]QNT78516.1 MltA specific insert domain protein [Entomobacter blattae]
MKRQRKSWVFRQVCGFLMVGVVGVWPLSGFGQIPSTSGVASGPAIEEDSVTFTPASYQDLPGWEKEKVGRFLVALSTQCQYFLAKPSNSPLGNPLGGAPFLAARSGSTAYWNGACAALKFVHAGDEKAAREFVERWFKPYRVSGEGQALVTGYFEPEIRGSLYRQGLYQIPVYARPPDLKTVVATDGSKVSGSWQNGTFVPYWSRAQINSGVLSGRQLELLWVADPVDLFFLQIQGSGRVLLEDGRTVRLAYAGKNGQPYVPIGRVLVQQGALKSEEVSMQTVARWLKQHSKQARQIMEQNPSYVFFRVVEGSATAWQGAPGTLGVGLIPGRSAAVDPRYLPLGSLLWVSTHVPSLKTGQQKSWSHLVLAQDTGENIKGPERIDLYMGWGEKAAWKAGYLQSEGAVYVLVPRQPKTP